MKRARFLLVLCASLMACVKYPEPYRPPAQRNPQQANPGRQLRYYISMNMPDAPDHFVSDVIPELMDGSWRWMLAKPTFQLQVPATQGMKLKAELAVPEVTFKQTGPVHIKVFVGTHELDTIEVAKPGGHTWEKAVPEDWLTKDRPIQVRLEVDKTWTAEGDGVKRGFILTSIGFVQ